MRHAKDPPAVRCGISSTGGRAGAGWSHAGAFVAPAPRESTAQMERDTVRFAGKGERTFNVFELVMANQASPCGVLKVSSGGFCSMRGVISRRA